MAEEAEASILGSTGHLKWPPVLIKAGGRLPTPGAWAGLATWSGWQNAVAGTRGLGLGRPCWPFAGLPGSAEAATCRHVHQPPGG